MAFKGSDNFSQTYFFIPVKREYSILQIIVYLDKHFPHEMKLNGMLSIDIRVSRKKRKLLEIKEKVELNEGYAEFFIDVKNNTGTLTITFNAEFAGKNLTASFNTFIKK